MEATPPTSFGIEEPFPIFELAHKYFLYDADTVSYIRQKYNISGVLIGSLAQAPQQNIFLGLPLELTPEEARLLVEKEVAYVVDDVRSHRRGFLENGLSVEERRAYQAALRKQGASAAKETSKKAQEKKHTALKKKAEKENWNDIPEDMLKPTPERRKKDAGPVEDEKQTANGADEDEALFASPMNSFPSGPSRPKAPSISNTTEPEPFAITPTASYPPLQPSMPPEYRAFRLPPASGSYPLFKHLHDEGYFLAPGLRFGCQYMAYPGDPLRFHSHFLCNGMEWDEEFDLLDLVGGGRLGTGVKKGFLIGGQEEPDVRVRTFCVEWGGM